MIEEEIDQADEFKEHNVLSELDIKLAPSENVRTSNRKDLTIDISRGYVCIASEKANQLMKV